MSLPWIQVDCYPKQETVVAGVVMATACFDCFSIPWHRVRCLGSTLAYKWNSFVDHLRYQHAPTTFQGSCQEYLNIVYDSISSRAPILVSEFSMVQLRFKSIPNKRRTPQAGVATTDSAYIIQIDQQCRQLPRSQFSVLLPNIIHNTKRYVRKKWSISRKEELGGEQKPCQATSLSAPLTSTS